MLGAFVVLFCVRFVAATFSQSLRALAVDRPRRSLWTAALAAVLLGGWLAWFFAAEVIVYETAETARIEVDRAAHTIDAPVAGRVKTSALELGREVEAGQVVVELDAELEQRRLAEERARLATLGPQIDALRRQLAAEEQVLRDARRASDSAIEEGRARRAEGDHAAALAQEEAKRAAQMFDGGALTEIELLRARTEAEKRRAAVTALALDVDRLAGEQRTRESEARSRIESLGRQIAELDGQKATSEAQIRVLEEAVSKRTIVSPVRGRVGEVAPLRAGAWVREGDKLGAVIPGGELRAIADFAPPAALGRLREGQAARLRLDGFPWTQYGTVGARVAKVASEARYGRIRVELDVTPDPHSRIPLQHGLPGSVEVEVERATPARLALRAAGKVLGRSGPSRRGAGE
ncbi:Membrane fusion component of tripartite multidrug resistance system [Minicystis rosea]|nr:Membrane fusion component of tripartite multidrug resistance system [Minicystis rosea]